MITGIPNQPLSFVPSLLQGCACDPLVPQLLIHPEEDNIIFQLGIDLCPGAESEIDNTDFQGANWKGGLGWTLFPGRACGTGIAGASLQDDSFSPEVDKWYTITFIVESVTDTVSWSIGGTSGTFGTTGTTTNGFTFTTTFQASSTAPLMITLDTANSSICLNMIAAYEANRDLTVEIIDAEGSVYTSFDTTADAEYFTFEDTIVGVNIPMSDVGIDGCFTVKVRNECGANDIVLESQQLRTTTDECTLKIRACNDSFSLGFLPTPLEIRVEGKVTHPTWEYEVSGERMSNGRQVNSYVDRQRSMELRIGLQSEYVHPFLSALPVFSHFYVGQTEYVFDGEPYEPGYADVFDGTGTVIMKIRPKQEIFRRVACAEESSGCVPPPNLWVQGTGPNENYILTQAGQTIELAN